MKNLANSLVAMSLLVCVGCTKDASVTPELHTDVAHDHGHVHSDGAAGTHSHDHRKCEPLHGGRVASIGHIHHNSGVTHFHAEVMPLVDNSIRFHLLAESDDEECIDYSIEDKEIPAIVGVKDRESRSQEAFFVSAADGDESAEFMLSIPASLEEGEAFSVVIPKITLGGQRLNFSFSVKRQEPAVDKQDTAKPKTETSDSATPEDDSTLVEDATEASDE